MKTINNRPEILSESLGTLLSKSFQTYTDLLEAGLEKANMILSSDGECGTCPHENTCPPKWIGNIYRKAMAMESILVPITIANSCSEAKTYKIGLRELRDVDGNLAPSQPILNKNNFTLEPNSSTRILMGINLANFSNKTYQQEIVVREQDFNQNILFTLEVVDDQGEVFIPVDEKKFRLKWQSWKTHFYCEPKRNPNKNKK